jgi:hypothetical protein
VRAACQEVRALVGLAEGVEGGAQPSQAGRLAVAVRLVDAAGRVGQAAQPVEGSGFRRRLAQLPMMARLTPRSSVRCALTCSPRWSRPAPTLQAWP